MKSKYFLIGFFFCFMGSLIGQDSYKNDLDIGLGYTLGITSSYLKLDYSLSEKSAIYFKGHYENAEFSIFDPIPSGVDTIAIPNAVFQNDSYLRFTLGIRHYFKNKNQEYIRAGWFFDLGASYRIDIEDDPVNSMGDYTVIGLESTIGFKYLLGNRFRIEPNAAFLFSGSFGGGNNSKALFDLDLYLGVSLAYSFGDRQLKKSKKKGKRKGKKRNRKR